MTKGHKKKQRTHPNHGRTNAGSRNQENVGFSPKQATTAGWIGKAGQSATHLSVAGIVHYG